MKQSAAKTLGVVAFGAALAAVGAGAAAAAPAVPDAGPALSGLTGALPADGVGEALQGPLTDGLQGAGSQLGGLGDELGGAGMDVAMGSAERLAAQDRDARAQANEGKEKGSPVGEVPALLGGLGLGEMNMGSGSNLNGLPLG
ncbi:ATP-binding protein [Streptomyces abyssomicinicus]|uniref:ATP-binding protein n=1 Tax=Streptomyces abyssomicinicus TaxID=574929 RepID=UPI00124FDEC8|nr:ATP-binding protein [Streptomyces abyssomicinicus]